MIRINLQTDAAAITQRLREFPPRMSAALTAKMDELNEITVGHIVETQLRGPRPVKLGVVSHRLWKSIRPSRAIVVADGIASSIGSNVEYLGVHEFGFRGPQFVKAHTRKVESRNVGKSGRKGVRKESAVALGFASVRAHTRQMDIPARAPLRTGIREQAPVYSRELSRVIVEEWSARG